MATWLKSQRKAALMELADSAGVEGVVANMRKDDLIVALEQQLRANASSLSKEPLFHDYFNRSRSPIKKLSEADVAHLVDPVPRKRVVRSVQSETEPESSPDPSSPGPIESILSRTPRSIQDAIAPASNALQEFTSSIPLELPASPAQVADMVERRASLAASNVRRFAKSHHIPQSMSSLREALSSAYAVTTAFILVEAWGLQRTTLPWKYAFSLPASKLTNDTPVRMLLPDFFALLDGSFWNPTLLWVTTSILVPAIFGWLFNFNQVVGRGRRGCYDIDPLVFNIVKILVTWLIFSQGQRFGGQFSDHTVQAVQNSVTGGWTGMSIGAVVSAILSLYEAILSK